MQWKRFCNRQLRPEWVWCSAGYTLGPLQYSWPLGTTGLDIGFWTGLWILTLSHTNTASSGLYMYCTFYLAYFYQGNRLPVICYFNLSSHFCLKYGTGHKYQIVNFSSIIVDSCQENKQSPTMKNKNKIHSTSVLQQVTKSSAFIY